MKKNLLLIVIPLLLLTFAGVAYWFITPVEERGERFAMFGFGDTTDESVDIADFDDDFLLEDVVDVFEESPLKQLTTTPVIAHQEVLIGTTTSQSATSTETIIVPYVYYVEAGTGHVFSINIETGEEERLSNITIPKATAASISASGERVAIKSAYGSQSNLYVVDLTSGEPSSRLIASGVEQFKINNDSLWYAKIIETNTQAYRYSFIDNLTTNFFQLPFAAATIVWATGTGNNHLVYPKPTNELPGYLYSMNGSELQRLPATGYGLTASNPDYPIYSVVENRNLRTYSIENSDEGFGLPFLPEKCGFDSNRLPSSPAVCGIPLSETADLPDAWYRGSVSFADNLWVVSPQNLNMQLLAVPEELVGQSLDIQFPSLKGSNFYFVNKTDSALWLYTFDENSLVL